MIELLTILLWWGIGGFDWFYDAIENLFTIKSIFIETYVVWEPNYNSYEEWVESMLNKDPSYEEDFLSRQEYVDSKYPNWNEIEDEHAINFILAELYGYENEL